MKAALLLLAALCLPASASAAGPGGWEASVQLQAVGDDPAALPQVLVPKQTVLLKVTVWMPQDINWNPRYPQWDMPGATVLSTMMLSPSIEREQGQATQRGATQNYLLTPLAEGALKLSPTSIPVYPDQADSPVLPITPVELQVALPDGAGSIEQFLPADALKLEQHYYLQRGADLAEEVKPGALAQLQLQPGEMLERRISIEARGIPGNQIPPLPVDPDAVQHQAEAVDLNSYGDFSGGKRTEHWFYAPGTKTSIKLQDLSVRWYELGARTFKLSQLTGGQVRAVATRSVDARLQLRWWEKLALVSPLHLAVLLTTVALVGVTFRYRRLVRRGLRHGLHAYRRNIHEAEVCQFTRMWCLIGLLGLPAHRSWRTFQQWQRRAGATESLGAYESIQRWCRYQFGACTSSLPRRVSVLRELLLLRRRTSRLEYFTTPGKYSLPQLREAPSFRRTH